MGFYNLETYDDYVYQTVNGTPLATFPTPNIPTACRRPAVLTYGVVYLSDLDIIEQQIAAHAPQLRCAGGQLSLG